MLDKKSNTDQTNTPRLETSRLILRRFTKNDAQALFEILRDEEVNTFLPWFPVQDMDETLLHLQDRYLDNYKKMQSYHYAICLKADNVPIGYLNVADDESYDLGYGLKKEYWRQGFATEACRAVLGELQSAGVPYITATHDRNNPKSGAVMERLGMVYCYSYEERVQPKDRLVVFRLYQLNFDGHNERVYRAYWDRYATHFVEKNR